ncbi:MAG: hypothetical protein P4L10_12435 [Acidobacteriaceae bacterium]|jgi:hypothetical protein|nr:hypothetical protein [Acidobacteriaceae bacterium]
MTDFIPKPTEIKMRGLGRKAQKLMALREKAAQANSGGKTPSASSATPAKALAGVKKTAFNRKAV